MPTIMTAAAIFSLLSLPHSTYPTAAAASAPIRPTKAPRVLLSSIIHRLRPTATAQKTRHQNTLGAVRPPPLLKVRLRRLRAVEPPRSPAVRSVNESTKRPTPISALISMYAPT